MYGVLMDRYYCEINWILLGFAGSEKFWNEIENKGTQHVGN